MGDTRRYDNDRDSLDRYANIHPQGGPNVPRRRPMSAAYEGGSRPASAAPSGQARPRSAAPAGSARPRPATSSGQTARPRPAASGPAARPRPASGQTARPRTAPAARPAPARKPERSKGFDFAALGNSVKGRVDALLSARPQQSSRRGSRRGPDWPMILAVSVTVIILIGILALCVIGIKNCSGGCSTNTEVAQGTANIYKQTAVPTAEPTAEPTDQPSVEDEPGQVFITPAATLVPSVGTANTEGLRSARIRSIGDFVIHEPLYNEANRLAKTTGVGYDYDFAPMLEMIKDVMGNADFTVANVDGPLGGKKYHKYGYRGYPQFNTPPHLLYALKDAGVDMLTLANNHMLDTWFDGLMAEIDNVEKLGMYHVGANRSEEEKGSAVIVEINGIKVGFMNYTEDLNSMERQKALDPRALTFGVNWTRNSNVTTDAKTLREAGAEVIVCYMHWGTEYKDVDADQNKYLSQLVKAGVDVVIGGHPHIVQKAQWSTGTNQFGEVQKTLCLFSMGNFLSDQRLAPRDGGIIFDFTIQERADGKFDIINPSYLPTWVWRTGTSEKNYSYKVLPIDYCMKHRPAGMSNEDYNAMVQSYQNSVSVMNTGVGACISE